MKKFKKFDPKRKSTPQSPVAQQRTPRGRPVVGIHATNELLRVRPKSVDQLWLRDKFQDHPDLKLIHEQAKAKGLKVVLQNPAVLDKVTSNHQGVMAFSSNSPQIDWAQLIRAERAVLLALDEVEDPHNLGAILRTGWLMGIDGVLIPERRAAHISPAVSKVAQGAVEHIPVEADQALPERLKQLKEHGFWILGLSHKAKQDLYTLSIPPKVVWVLGSESSGLRRSVEGACDDLVSIPQKNPEASYNVSVAAALALAQTYQSARNG